MTATPSQAEHDDLILSLARIGADANTMLRSGADPDTVRAWVVKETPRWRTGDLLMVLAAALPDDRTVEELLAWTVAGLPPSERPSWSLLPAHAEYVECAAELVPSEIPVSVREGEAMYQAARRREASRFPSSGLPAAS